MPSEISRGWIEAAKTLCIDPAAQVACPKCGAEFLGVFDTPIYGGKKARIKLPALRVLASSYL